MIAYVSYCQNDFRRIKPLLLRLGGLGYGIHFEQKTPAARTRWKYVLASIRQCDIFVLVLTEYSLRSDARRVEYDYAVSLGKPVVTIGLTSTQPLASAEFANLLDYRPTNPQRDADLKQVFSTLPNPADASSAPRAIPGWVAPLTQLQTLITMPKLSVMEQKIVLYNIQEALERQETLLAGELMLELLASRDDIDAKIQTRIQQTTRHIRQSYARQRHARWQNTFWGGLVILTLVVGSTFVVSRRLANTAVATEITAEMTTVASPETALNAEVTDPVIVTPESESTALPASSSMPAASAANLSRPPRLVAEPE
jgi:hypothetical protein